MARAAGPKSKDKRVLDLTGCPDPTEDLLGARLWVLENLFKVTLRGWQLRVFEDIGTNERARIFYVQIARKNGKTFLMACFLLTELILLPERHCYAVSDSERNLTSVLFREVETLVNKNQDVAEALHLYATKVENPENLSFLELCPSTFAASQGKNPHVVCFDELHLQKDDRPYQGWIASGADRDDFILLATTTPGYDNASMCHDVYLQCKAGFIAGVVYEPSATFQEDPDSDYTDREVWAEANPTHAERPNFLTIMEHDLGVMRENEFRRYRLGQWTAAEGSWLPYGAAKACVTEQPFEATRPCWLGFDGSYSGDSTSLWLVNDLFQVLLVGHWENPSLLVKGEVDKSWRVPRDEVLEAIHVAFNTYDVQKLVADPPYWQTELYELAKTYRGKVLEFPTGYPQRMAPACTLTYSAIVERKLQFCGDASILLRHLSNCHTKDTPHGTLIVKQQEWSPKKIDAAVALCVAVDSALKARVRHPAGAR